MKIFQILIAIIFLSVAVLSIERCATEDSDTHSLRLQRASLDQSFMQALAKKKKKKKPAKQVATPSPTNPKATENSFYEIPVMFHVIMNNEGTDGIVPLDSLQKNIQSANDVFSGRANTRGTGFETYIRVYMVGVTYHYNTTWFENCKDYSTANRMKYATALFSATTTNVWTCKSTSLLGWTNFLPYDLVQYSVWNGLNINFQAFPLSDVDPTYTNYGGFGDGDTFTHEFGHYLGLLHTFGNGVSGCSSGDNIDDTPAENTPANGRACKIHPPRDSCPQLPGVDPVWNIMDYADDYCAQEFTPMQVEVMKYNVDTYKPKLRLHEPLPCVADGNRGSASIMTVCKSVCYNSIAPDNAAAPTSGWCRTDDEGGWGGCCCSGKCNSIAPVTTFPSELKCEEKQTREELFKNPSVVNSCLIADTGGEDKQVTVTQCSNSAFVRWAFTYDGSISSIGTGWCLALLGFDGKNATSSSIVGLEPCVSRKPNQVWNVLPTTGASYVALNALPSYCLDSAGGSLSIQKCNVLSLTQSFQRVIGNRCSTLKNQADCVNSIAFGCTCSWKGKSCVA